jgi:3-deoxy-D-manno-octulosonate 8-phosphate phosphatase (KDO 8-P phosphatase)
MAAPTSKVSKSLRARLARVKILLCDVDGVLTNTTVLIGEGREFKQFHIQDGLGLRLLQMNGVKVGWVSNRPSNATRQRADELKIDYLFQDKGSKVEAVETILKRAGFDWSETVFVGDDVVDLGALKRAGVAIAVANAIEEAKALAHYVTRAEGGHGAVREVVTLILKAQNKWDKLIEEFTA